MSKNIFITGADGFIGSHLTEAAVLAGYNVKALAQYNSFNDVGWLADLPKEILSHVNIVMGDVRDASQMIDECKGSEFILHLAALIAIPYSYKAPQSYINTNINGTLNMMQAARTFDIPIIHTSTSEVYGTAQFVPISEEHPLQGQSPYSASKIGADQLAFSFYTSFGTPVKIIRPFNTYGPRQSLRAVIPTIITQIVNGERRIKLGSTSPTRDFSFVRDTVAGFIHAIESPLGFGEVINVGSGFEVSIGQTAHIIAETLNTQIEIISDEKRVRPEKSEVERLFACNKKSKQLLGWKPQYHEIDGFKKGIARTVDWFAEKNNISKYENNGYVI